MPVAKDGASPRSMLLGKFKLLQELPTVQLSAAGPLPTHQTFVVEEHIASNSNNNPTSAQGSRALDELALARIYSLELLSRNHTARTAMERSVLVQRAASSCRHIVHLKEVFATSMKDVCVVEDYCEGGELFELLESFNREERKKKKATAGDERLIERSDDVVGLPPKIVRRLMSELLEALDFLHRSLRVCHRDIKLEHIFLDSENRVRLGGFGMAVPVTDCSPQLAFEHRQKQGDTSSAPEVLLTVMCGSRHYAAPEIVKSVPYKGCAADMWSVGVCAFTLLTGTFPFDGSVPTTSSSTSSLDDPIQTMVKGNARFESIDSRAARDFILKLMCRDPQMRMTAHEALQHPFVAPPAAASSSAAKAKIHSARR